MYAIIASGVLALIATFHSMLGESAILRPLFAVDWDIGIPRYAAERILRFAWHLTSVAWLGLAAALVGLSVVDAAALVSLVSGLIILLTLRGHLAWPLFLFAAACAWASAGQLWPPAVQSIIVAASSVAVGAMGLHVYWAFGGKKGLANAVPQTPDGRPVFSPGALACLMVAFACVVLGAAMLWPLIGPTPDGIFVVLVVAALLLAVRVIGDGRQTGFTKQNHSTAFAQADDAVYTPLFTLLLFGALCALYAGWHT